MAKHREEQEHRNETAKFAIARFAVEGFTLIELLIVMAILATLLSIVVPRYFASLNRAKEAALRTDLRVLREAIDNYKADTGQYPNSLQQLTASRYLRSIPADPVTDSSTGWTLLPVPDGSAPGIYDVHSGSVGVASDGSAYAAW